MPDDSTSKRKAWWEIIVALTPLILGICVTGVGTFFTHIYNLRQLQINQIAALEKVRPLLTSEKAEEREFAYSSFAALGYEDIAIRIIKINKDESGRSVLTELQQSSAPLIRESAGDALKALDEAQKIVNIFEYGDPRGLLKYQEMSSALANELGIKTKLGVAVLYDTVVQNGLPKANKIAQATTDMIGSTPKKGGDEKQWIREFLQQRSKIFKGPYSDRIVQRRINEFNKLIERNDWDLKTFDNEDSNSADEKNTSSKHRTSP